MLPLKKQGNPTEGAVIPVQVRRDEREGKAGACRPASTAKSPYEEPLALAKGQGRVPALPGAAAQRLADLPRRARSGRDRRGDLRAAHRRRRRAALVRAARA